MSLSLLLQQCPVCLVRLTWIVFVMGGGCIVGALWDVAARTYSILLATFLCKCHLASPAILLASEQQYRHDRCLEETAFHFISQVWFLLQNSIFQCFLKNTLFLLSNIFYTEFELGYYLKVEILDFINIKNLKVVLWIDKFHCMYLLNHSTINRMQQKVNLETEYSWFE